MQDAIFQVSARIMTEELSKKCWKISSLGPCFQTEMARSKHFWLSSLTVLLYNTLLLNYFAGKKIPSNHRSQGGNA